MSSWFGWGAPAADAEAPKTLTNGETANMGDDEDNGAGGGMLDRVLDKAKDLAADIVEDVKAIAEVIEEKAEDVGDAIMHSAVGPQIRAFKEITVRFEKHVEEWMKMQVIKELEIVIDKLPTIIKTQLNSDPDMMQIVWRSICRFIDKSWPDIRVELLADIQVQLGLAKPIAKVYETDTTTGCTRFCAWFRYRLDPFDRSIWGKVKHPIWLLLAITMMVPVTYVSAWGFLFFFLVIDRSDEYQLCQFYLFSKNCQFVAQGLIRMLVGYFQFLDCVTAVAREDYHKCQQSGPGQWGPLWFVIGGWAVQISLNWIALALLPCTVSHHEKKSEELKGRYALEEHVAEGQEFAVGEEIDKRHASFIDRTTDFTEHKETLKAVTDKFHRSSTAALSHITAKQKRNLRRMIVYDAIITSLVVGIVVWRLWTSDDWDSYRVRSTIYSGQVGYGLLSLPFFIFQIPFLQRVLLHCHRTGYDVLGRIRFYQGPVKPERRPEVDVSNLSSADITSLFGKVVSAVGGEQAVTADLHKFGNCNAMSRVRCASCARHITEPRSKAWTCEYCKGIYCVDCEKIARKQPCDKAKRAHERERKHQEEKEKFEQAESQHEESKRRYEVFTSMWQLSGSLVQAMSCIDGSAESMNEFSEVMKAALKKASHQHLETLVDRIPILVKWMTSDDDMPKSVGMAKDNAIDYVWKDMREEILYSLKVAMQPAPKVDDEDTTGRVDCLRAKIRHSEMPCDRSIFWQLKQPTWWFMRTVTLIPWGGILPLVFLFLFLIIDKGDEFQLVQFILLFKGSQFISHGIIKTAIGFFTYVKCTFAAQGSLMDHECETSGPGVIDGWRVFEVMFGGWVLQILLVWTAFFMLPCSEDKARSDLIATDVATKEILADYEAAVVDIADAKQQDSAKKTNASKKGGWSAGGKIRYLLFWDMFAFLSSVAVMVWIMTTRPAWDWVVIHTFFACQVVYGYLAMPFFIFSIPLLRETLTHSVQSGYDSYGRIRPLVGPTPKSEEQMKKDLQWLEDEKAKIAKKHGEQVEEEQRDYGLQELTKKIREMFTHLFPWAAGDAEEAAEGAKVEEHSHASLLSNLGTKLGSLGSHFSSANSAASKPKSS